MALNPSTPESTIEYVLDRLDLILLMTVNPGFGGQAFIPAMVEKVRRVKATDRRSPDRYRGRWRHHGANGFPGGCRRRKHPGRRFSDLHRRHRNGLPRWHGRHPQGVHRARRRLGEASIEASGKRTRWQVSMTTIILLLLLAAVLVWAFAESRTAGTIVALALGAVAAAGLGYYIWRDATDSQTSKPPPAARERAPPPPEQFKRSLTDLQPSDIGLLNLTLQNDVETYSGIDGIQLQRPRRGSWTLTGAIKIRPGTRRPRTSACRCGSIRARPTSTLPSKR